MAAIKATKSRPLRTVFLSFLGLIIVFWTLVIFKVGYRKYQYWVHEQNRPKQAEVKIILDGILDAQREYYKNNGRYASDMVEHNYVVPSGTHYYTAYLGESTQGHEGNKQTPPKWLQTSSNEREFIAIAYGNIDDDALPDVWTVTQDGAIVNVIDDVMNGWQKPW